jgi:ABC-type Na+ efflux pump permease subunit
MLVMSLVWLALTGSLGMLLQAISRERANRALETLRASAEGASIVAGKLLGVALVSGVVVFAWLGSCVVAAALRPTLASAADLLHELASPALLVRAAASYALGFLFFGSVTLAVGAAARDSADAQNLARPLFAVLLVCFFVALAGNRVPVWLVGLPPLTPFLLIVSEPPFATLAIGVAGAIVAALLAGAAAVRRLG